MAGNGSRGRGTCVIEGCGKIARGHGLCGMHYARQYRHGDTGGVQPIRSSEPMSPYPCKYCGETFVNQDHPGRADYCSRECQHASMAHPREALSERFSRQVDKTSEHWMWTGYVDPNGYGRIQLGSSLDGSRRPRLATSVAWLLATGEPVPDGLEACHTCDIPGCVRNDEIGTYEVRGISYPRCGHLFIATQAVNLIDMHEKGRYVNGMKLRAQRDLEHANVI